MADPSKDLIKNPTADTILNPVTHLGNLQNTLGDHAGAGQSHYGLANTDQRQVDWGGDPNMAAINSGHNTALGDQNSMMAARGYDTMMNMGPGQSQEDGRLSGAFDANRYGDQASAMGLMRDAAMGNAPSFAEMQQRQGIGQAMAAQQSMAGSARGSAGLALAGMNAANNTAQLQQQGAMQGSALRAQEMAQARGAYGDMSNQVGAQALQRLGQSSQMGMNNANNYNQFALGAGNVGAAYGNTGLGYAKNAQNPFSDQLNSQTQQSIHQSSLDQQMELARQEQEWKNQQQKVAQTDKEINFFGNLVSTVAGGAKGAAAGAGGGPAGMAAGAGVGIAKT